MSRHLLIRCDRAGCAEQTETRASDDAPTSIGVPDGWITVRVAGKHDEHYCSLACLADALWSLQPGSDTLVPLSELTAPAHTNPWHVPAPIAVPAPIVPPSPSPSASPPSSPKRNSRGTRSTRKTPQ